MHQRDPRRTKQASIADREPDAKDHRAEYTKHAINQ